MAIPNSSARSEPSMIDVEECSISEPPKEKEDSEDVKMLRRMINEVIERAVQINSQKDTEAIEKLKQCVHHVDCLIKEYNYKDNETGKTAYQKLFDKLPSKTRFMLTDGKNKPVKNQTLNNLIPILQNLLDSALKRKLEPSVVSFGLKEDTWEALQATVVATRRSTCNNKGSNNA